MQQLAGLSSKFFLSFFAISLLFACNNKRSGNPKVLVFSKTAGFHHASIDAGNAALLNLGKQNGFDVDTTTNTQFFTEDSLKRYAAVVFLNTTGDVLNHRQEAAFERFIQAGGGYVGIHAAADTEYDWGWYARMVGGNFVDHPGIKDTFPGVQPGVLRVVDKKHPATGHLQDTWSRADEWYSYKNANKDVKVLLELDNNSYKGGERNDPKHPISWYHDYDGGRAFYTGLGHTNESYAEPEYLKHILGGIRYAMGENKELDYDKARTLLPPEEDRFVKTVLTTGQFFEPTEMAILPNFDILVAQRRGELMLYNEKSKSVRQVGRLNVYHQTSVPGVNAEEGLLGLAADPNFKSNNYIYLFYSPADTSVNRLSRFTYKNDTLDLSTEKVVLQFYSQRQICCHTGGSIAFGKDNLLYLSTGDNTTPFDEPNQRFVNKGYAPLDDRPGHEQYDARRTSGNTNDLRGKILRIRIKADGSYEIPEGNLFPKNEPKARPEIFVMGNRNPYRISVDQRTGFLYWGEVGPDAASDSNGVRGPRGYDEMNQARKAGYFGWPLFVGNNYAYHEYDFNTGKPGTMFNASSPQNNSRNNTGLQQLPPAQPAFIWYPYAPSPDFPQTGTGGRNAMTGPIYYPDDFPKDSRLPDYYAGKLFIYDWMRGWIKAVTMKPNGDFEKMEPFMEHTKFNNMIDMEMGPDGRMYVLEYGSGWFSKNEDAGLSRIDYLAGNRPPKVAGITVDKESGALPYTFTATVDVKDPEGDALSYIWTIGDQKVETKEPRLQHTISKMGDYDLAVEVVDAEKASVKSSVVPLYAGNDMPDVDIRVQGNRSFYFPGKPVQYTVGVSDKGDSVNTANLYVSTDYVAGFDQAENTQGHQRVSGTIVGKNIMLSLDCKACHKEQEKSIGPAYAAVAARYQKKPEAAGYLADKIIKGGAGVWGDVAMPAHPDLKKDDALQIVNWVLSLAQGEKQKSLPASGSVNPAPKKGNGVFVLQATYTDNGGTGIRPLSSSNSLYLRPAAVDMSRATKMKDFSTVEFGGMKVAIVPKTTGWILLDSIDLSGINAAELMIGWQAAPQYGFAFELRLDAPNGPKIGEATLPGGLKGKGTMIRTAITPVNDGRFHNLYVVSRVLNPAEPGQVGLTRVQFGAK